MDITSMLFEIRAVLNSMIGKAPLPDLHPRTDFFHEAMGITALDELHDAFQRNGRLRSKQKMDMVGHHNEFVELKDASVPIAEQRIEE